MGRARLYHCRRAARRTSTTAPRPGAAGPGPARRLVGGPGWVRFAGLEASSCSGRRVPRAWDSAAVYAKGLLSNAGCCWMLRAPCAQAPGPRALGVRRWLGLPLPGARRPQRDRRRARWFSPLSGFPRLLFLGFWPWHCLPGLLALCLFAGAFAPQRFALVSRPAQSARRVCHRH